MQGRALEWLAFVVTAGALVATSPPPGGTEDESRTLRASLEFTPLELNDGATEASSGACLSTDHISVDPVEFELRVSRRLFDSTSGEEMLEAEHFSSAPPMSVYVHRMIQGGSELLAADALQRDITLTFELSPGSVQEDAECSARFHVTVSSPGAGSSGSMNSTVAMELKATALVSRPQGDEAYPTLRLREEAP